MKTWRAPDLPSLPGTGRVPILHDQSSGERRVSAEGAAARMYVCGITPYDSTHIGHSATYLAFDLLGRAWRDAGLSVSYVQNITDVDDPLLERARETGDDWRALAARQVDLFSEDMAALRVIPPDHFVGATEVIPLIVAAIEELRARGATYEVEGDTYFDITHDPRFGQVSGWTEAEMLAVYADRGGDPDRPGKRNPLDCLVWLTERPGEPSWDGGALGRGRPGWHIECAAIALKYLGAGFDVQGGGSDLIFPHHEMCVSEATVLLDSAPFARLYAYQGMVGLDGEKMSKSKGNLVFSSTLRARGVDPMAIRLSVLAHHYRDDWEWTDAELDAAQDRLARWRSAVERSRLDARTGSGRGAESGNEVVEAVRRAIGDDLNAPAALAVIDAWAADPPAETSAALVADVCDALLGVRL